MKTMFRRTLQAIAGVYLMLTSVATAFAGQSVGINPTVAPSNLPGTQDLGTLLTRVINYFLGFVGLIAVLMLVIGGLRYITSGGNEQTVEKAKNTILYAIIGIVIVVLAYAIVWTITSTLTTL